jgi:hypothetical protein
MINVLRFSWHGPVRLWTLSHPLPLWWTHFYLLEFIGNFLYRMAEVCLRVSRMECRRSGRNTHGIRNTHLHTNLLLFNTWANTSSYDIRGLWSMLFVYGILIALSLRTVNRLNHWLFTSRRTRVRFVYNCSLCPGELYNPFSFYLMYIGGFLLPINRLERQANNSPPFNTSS